jgi:ribosomal protein S18 acetylase RimI-like enzyme
MNATSIVRLERTDLPAARKSMGRAFQDYNLMAYAKPSERLAAVTSLYGAILKDCFLHGEVYGLGACTGVAGWLPPSSSAPTFLRQARAGMLAIPWHFGFRGFRILDAYDKVARRLHHDHAPMPHWFLAAIGVDAGHQGQGIGSALMRPMLERADRERLHCWLDTHQEANVRLYERHGFVVAERATLPEHPIPVYGMLRPPQI